MKSVTCTAELMRGELGPRNMDTNDTSYHKLLSHKRNEQNITQLN